MEDFRSELFLAVLKPGGRSISNIYIYNYIYICHNSLSIYVSLCLFASMLVWSSVFLTCSYFSRAVANERLAPMNS